MKGISDTSPLLYLYRIGGIEWLGELFEEVWVPMAVVAELAEGRRRGYDVPIPESYVWIQTVQPRVVPSEWLAADLGRGELSVMALGLEHREAVVILDDLLARRIAQAAGLQVWGTLRVMVQAKAQGLIPAIAPYVERLRSAGMWLSEEIEERILRLAGEVP